MKSVFLVKRKDTGQYLNQKGTWSKSVTSYRLKEFETREEAEGAFLENVECLTTKRPKREKTEESSSSIKYKYYLEDLNNKCFLNASNEFKVWAAIMPEAISFDSQDAALDKAEELNLNLDKIRVIRLASEDKLKK